MRCAMSFTVHTDQEVLRLQRTHSSAEKSPLNGSRIPGHMTAIVLRQEHLLEAYVAWPLHVFFLTVNRLRSRGRES